MLIAPTESPGFNTHFPYRFLLCNRSFLYRFYKMSAGKVMNLFTTASVIFTHGAQSLSLINNCN